MKKKLLHIAIIGVGLIGGSIALTLKNRMKDHVIIHGNCKNPKRTLRTIRLGIIDAQLQLHHLEMYDFLILGTPIDASRKILKSISSKIAKNTIILDTAGTKVAICQEAETYSLSNFIGTHPMAGSETSGFEGSDPFLFVNKPWVFCPTRISGNRAQKEVQKFIHSLGAIPISLAAEKHDRIAASASHLHLVMASIIMSSVAKRGDWPVIAKLASSGFRDSTRLASHNPQIKTEIVSSNKKNVADALRVIQNSIEEFLLLLEDDMREEIFQYFRFSKTIRDNWISEYFH